MLEHAIYSVISPEGAASILWRDTTKAQDAATNMKITAQDLTAFGVIDGIVTEPVGGAHRDPAAAIAAAGEAIAEALRRAARASTARPCGGSAARSSSPSAAASNRRAIRAIAARPHPRGNSGRPSIDSPVEFACVYPRIRSQFYPSFTLAMLNRHLVSGLGRLAVRLLWG